MRTLVYYTDPGHGWLHVPADCLAALHLTPQHFTEYSYIGREGALYLEEDCDMPRFLRIYEKACGETPILKESHARGESFVRGMPRISHPEKQRALPYTHGRQDYERDVAKTPLYPDGTPRKAWHQLDDLCRSTWEKPATA